MTEQELQDKAKDLAKNVPLRTDTPYPEKVRYFFASMYLRGYDDGKNDTTEWHYPSKGEYPTDGEEVWVAWTSAGSYDVVKFRHCLWGIRLSPPYAWQYIIPPKEEA